MTFLGEYTMLDMLLEHWSPEYFRNVIDETIYRTKRMEIIEALGVVQALYTPVKHELKIEKKIYDMSNRIGRFPIYEETEEESVMDSDESQNCYVSDCESCDYESEDSCYTSEASSMSIDTDDTENTDDSYEQNQVPLPQWKTEEPKQLDDSLINVLESFADLKQATFCITGLLKNFNRAQAEYFIKYKNGIVSQNMSKKVDYLVVGHTEVGKTKLDLAKRYNTRMISEEEMIALLSESVYSLYQSELRKTLDQVKTKLEAQENLKKVQTELLSKTDTMDWTFDWSILDQIQ